MGSSTQTMLELVAAGDVDVAAGFYDGRAASVREYCVRLCSSELVDDATLATFINFRGRAGSVPPDADPDDILRLAARAAAAGRLDLGDKGSAECRATGELLVARMNRELIRGEDTLEQHLRRCLACRRMADRLTDAEAALGSAGGEPPPGGVRAAWLELVGWEEPEPEPAAPEPEPAAPEREPAAPEPEPIAGEPEPEPIAGEPEPIAREPEPAPAEPERKQQPAVSEPEPPPPSRPQPPPTIRVRARRGGLVGAALRLASSTRRHQ